jgi:hypothetical protein
LHQLGLTINLEKCVFAVESFESKSHLVSAQGAKPLSNYVEAVEKRSPSTTIKVLQSFLGLVNYYWRFLPSMEVTLLPLTDALKGNRPSNEKLAWSAEMEASFLAAKASPESYSPACFAHGCLLLAHGGSSTSTAPGTFHLAAPGVLFT